MKLPVKLHPRDAILIYDNGIEETFELVTPAIASEWLANKGPQRNLRANQAKKYGYMMDEHQWEVTFDAMCFDLEGRQRNGQNRSEGIIKSGKPQWFKIWRKVPESVLAAIDSGMSRTFTDLTKMLGIDYARDIAAASRHWWQYESGALFNANQRLVGFPELTIIRDDHLTTMLTVADQINEAVKQLVPIEVTRRGTQRKTNKKSLRKVLTTPRSCLVFTAGYYYDKYPTQAIQFINDVVLGTNLSANSPVWLYRNWISNFHGRKPINAGVRTAIAINHALIKTINAVANKDAEVKAITTGGKFPKFNLPDVTQG